jgi:hypothetical protein
MGYLKFSVFLAEVVTELSPECKASGVAFDFGLFNEFLEFISWKEI